MVEPSTAEVVLAKPLSHKQIQRRLATIPYRLSLRILITVLARHCSSSTPTEKDIDLSISYENNFLGAKTAQESAELKAFYATLLLYLTRRKKPLSLPALRCFVYQQAGLDVLTAFDKELRAHLHETDGDVAALLAAQRSVEKDKNPSASSLPSPFFARNSLVGAFVCQLELDCHGLDFPAHQRLYADWRAFSTSGEQGLEEAELIELSAEWKGWDVRAVAEKLALGAKWSKNAKNNEKNNILAQKSNKAELKAEKLVKTKGLMEEETEEEMELG